MARIFIGIPCYQMVPPEVLEDYMRLAFHVGRRSEHQVFLGIKTKSEQFRARNAIVTAAAQVDADYVWMLDDDHKIGVRNLTESNDDYSILDKLLSHFTDDSVGIVGCLYYHRGGEVRPVIMTEEGGRFRYLRDDEIKHGLQEVAVQGGGCMLISMNVFRKIGYEPFAPEFEFGTDVQLSKQIREAGFKVLCDTSIEIGHWISERRCVTSANRHEFYAETMDRSDNIAQNALIGSVMKKFTDRVCEYLGKSKDELVELAKLYPEHAKHFSEYLERRQVPQYYIESGEAYLARACFIHSSEANRPFDTFLLKTVKGNFPGVGIDFGCGSAPITYELLSRQQIMHFIDIDGSAPYEFLKWRASVEGHSGLSAFFTWPDAESCDYAIAADSIEHLEDWREILYKIAKSLKPGGILITNFMSNRDIANEEHIFMDKPAFMNEVTRLGLYPINLAMFQKGGV